MPTPKPKFKIGDVVMIEREENEQHEDGWYQFQIVSAYYLARSGWYYKVNGDFLQESELEQI